MKIPRPPAKASAVAIPPGCWQGGGVLSRMAKWLVIVALILSVGGHWAFLQSVAWLGMAVSFSRTDSLSTALVKTFNGENPCGLCKFVKAGKKAEKESETKFEIKKLDLLAVNTGRFYFPPLRQTSDSPSRWLQPRGQAPPTPPPLV